MSTNSASAMDLTPHSGTHSRIHFPYLLPSDILSCSIILPSSQTMNVNVPPSPTITWLSTHSVSQFRTMVVSELAQTSNFNPSMGSSFMPSISILNVTRGQYIYTLYNILGAIPSRVGGNSLQP